MKKQKKQTKDWCFQIGELNGLIEVVIDDLDAFEKESGERVEAENSDQPLFQQLREIQTSANRLHKQLCANLGTKLAAHRPMSEMEYYLMRARGYHLWTAEGLGISPISDYVVFLNCCYEDERIRTYILPDTKPPVEKVDKKTGRRKVPIRIGRSPEELHLKKLKPEQRRFFAKYAPDVFKRFIAD